MGYAFSPDELESMRNIQTGHMMDRCKVQTIIITPNNFGEQLESWNTGGIEIICGLEMQAGAERHGVDNTILEYDAVLRLPLGTTLDARDRIEITKRFGEVQNPTLVYSIVGPVRFGATGIRILLKRIET